MGKASIKRARLNPDFENLLPFYFFKFDLSSGCDGSIFMVSHVQIGEKIGFLLKMTQLILECFPYFWKFDYIFFNLKKC